MWSPYCSISNRLQTQSCPCVGRACIPITTDCLWKIILLLIFPMCTFCVPLLDCEYRSWFSDLVGYLWWIIIPLCKISVESDDKIYLCWWHIWPLLRKFPKAHTDWAKTLWSTAQIFSLIEVRAMVVAPGVVLSGRYPTMITHLIEKWPLLHISP